MSACWSIARTCYECNLHVAGGHAHVIQAGIQGIWKCRMHTICVMLQYALAIDQTAYVLPYGAVVLLN